MQDEKRNQVIFDAFLLPFWRHTVRRRKRTSSSSYASQRKLDKCIILIILAQRFPGSGSPWWSARSPPCYSRCAIQVSTCMSVFISQMAQGWLYFPLLFFLQSPGVNEIGTDSLLCAAYQWIVLITQWTESMQKCTRWMIKYVVSMLFCSESQFRAHCTD